jgi:hypothetical protein
MSNNYTLFSTAITDLTKEETAWVQDVFVAINTIDEGGDVLPGGDYDITKEAEAKAFDERYGEGMSKLMLSISIDTDCFGFDASIDEDGDLWSVAEETGDPECAATLIQAFFAKFRPKDTHTLEWANTCSRPQVGEFGGGACLITADWIHFPDWRADFDNMVDKYQKLKASNHGTTTLEDVT